MREEGEAPPVSKKSNAEKKVPVSKTKLAAQAEYRAAHQSDWGDHIDEKYDELRLADYPDSDRYVDLEECLTPPNNIHMELTFPWAFRLPKKFPNLAPEQLTHRVYINAYPDEKLIQELDKIIAESDIPGMYKGSRLED